jgi:Bacterial Ig domain
MTPANVRLTGTDSRRAMSGERTAKTNSLLQKDASTRSRQDVLRLLLAALGATALALTGASAAEAGTFTIGDCPAAADHTLTAGPWWLILGDAPLALKQDCSGGPGDWIGLATGENGPLLEGVGVDTGQLPLAIVHIRVWWRAVGAPTGSASAEIVASNRDGTLNVPIITWAQPDMGSIWDTTAGPQELEFPASDEVDLVRLGEVCAMPYNETVTGCPTQGGLQYDGLPVLVQLYGAEVTLFDDTPPTVTLTSAPEATTPTTGPIPMSFRATDPVGIRKSELLVDGTPVRTHDYSSLCSYTEMRPCPENEPDQLSTEGSSLPEGTHQIAVRVTDAAGNSSVSPSRTVNTVRPPMPNGDPCPTPTISLRLSRKSPVPFGQPAAVEGRLGCGPTPIAGATVELDGSTLSGAHPVVLGSLKTTAEGGFTYALPSGPSRKLTFRYTAYSNQTAPEAQAALDVAVKPRITLDITPRRTHNHGKITWRGRIEGGPYPAAGITLLAQVLNVTLESVRQHHRWKTVRHQEWLTFHEIVAHQGKIAYHWTFRHTSRPTIYTFRVATPAGGAAGYEYAPAASDPVSVQVG